jgi:hypothetical protein
LAEELLQQRKMKPHPAAVRDGGLEAILAVREFEARESWWREVGYISGGDE